MEALAYADHWLVGRSEVSPPTTSRINSQGVRGSLELLKGMLRDPKQIEFLEKAEPVLKQTGGISNLPKNMNRWGEQLPYGRKSPRSLSKSSRTFDLSGIVFEGPAPRFSGIC